jgi:myo-inositol-1(or 4)-monophosphatase
MEWNIFKKNPRTIAVEAARKAAKIQMKYFGKIKQIKSKGVAGLVTNADIEAEKAIVKIIKKNFPKHDILAEEGNNVSKGSDFKWLIDPLDGTTNYIYRSPFFGVTLALEHKKEVILGIIYLPIFKQMYIAEKGKGAFLNGKKIHVSDRKMNRSMLLYSGGLQRDKKMQLHYFDKLIDIVFRIRIIGSAVVNFVSVAKGNAELYVDHQTNPWDIAAGCLLVEEAGGKVTDFDGNKWDPYLSSFVASNGKQVHTKVLKVLHGK